MSEPTVQIPADAAMLLINELERAFATRLVRQMRLRLHVCGQQPWLVIVTWGQYPEVDTAGERTGRVVPGYLWEAADWDDEEGADALPDHLGARAFVTVAEALTDATQELMAKGGEG